MARNTMPQQKQCQSIYLSTSITNTIGFTFFPNPKHYHPHQILVNECEIFSLKETKFVLWQTKCDQEGKEANTSKSQVNHIKTFVGREPKHGIRFCKMFVTCDESTLIVAMVNQNVYETLFQCNLHLFHMTDCYNNLSFT